MTSERLSEILSRYADLRVAILGDLCLDRYFEIDPTKKEISIETGLEVRNVVHVRAQPGAAGTILNNLVALGVGEVIPVSFRGDDAEGWLLQRALSALPCVNLDHLVATGARQTFAYSKPLILREGEPPVELNRLDQKNWTPTPAEVSAEICRHLREVVRGIDGVMVMDQVEVPNTGVVTESVLGEIANIAKALPGTRVLADSRRGLAGYPPVLLKMNLAELGTLSGQVIRGDIPQVQARARKQAQRHGKPLFVTLAEKGIVHADPQGRSGSIPALPLRGPIDIVGAGDAVSANLIAALAAGASLNEAAEISMVAASIVVHQLGTTGTAAAAAIRSLMGAGAAPPSG